MGNGTRAALTASLGALSLAALVWASRGSWKPWALELAARSGRGPADLADLSVSVEEIGRSQIRTGAIPNFRQALRFVDNNYVRREQVDPQSLLEAGLRALAAFDPGEIEYRPGVAAALLQRPPAEWTAKLCAQAKGRRVLCAEQPGRTLALRSGKEAVADLVRVGERVFLLRRLNESRPLAAIEAMVTPLLLAYQALPGGKVDKALHAFLNGALASADPHSAFLSREEYRDLRGGTRGQFGGVGLVLDRYQGVPLVKDVIANSPAHVAGIRPGDSLLQVGQAVVSFAPLADLLSRIRGIKAQEPVPVWVHRPSTGRVFQVFLSREEVPVRSVKRKSVIGRNDVLYFKVSGFSAHTADDLYAFYEQALIADASATPKYFVLDLRGNPGGLLDEGLQLSDLFLDSGRIITTKTRRDEQSEDASDGRKIQMPVVVLVDSGSASASEIVAGALRDNQRALVVGERTFGKGSVQSLYELEDGQALKLTMAQYFTPNGSSIQSVGVDPSVQVRLVQAREAALWMVGSQERERKASLRYVGRAPEEAGRTPLEGRFAFEAQGHQAVWAQADAPRLSASLERPLAFADLTGEGREAAVELERDPLARVGISLLEKITSEDFPLGDLSPKRVASAAHAVQQEEARRVRQQVGARDQALGKGLASFFAAPPTGAKSAAKAWKVDKALGEDAGKARCCDANSYTLRISEDSGGAGAQEGVPESGMVGLFLESDLEGSAAWVPARVGPLAGGKRSVSFQIPQVLRDFLNQESANGTPAALDAFFKPHVDADSQFAGRLSVDSGLFRDEGGGRNLIAAVDSANKITVTLSLPRGDPAAQDSFHLLELHALTVKELRLPNERVRLEALHGRGANGGAALFRGSFKLECEAAICAGAGGGGSAETLLGVVGATVLSQNGQNRGIWPLVSIGEAGRLRPLSAASSEGSAALRIP